MQRIMISLPMAGRTDAEIKEVIAKTEAAIEAIGHEPVNPYIEEEAPQTINKGVWYLSRSLGILASCDGIYMCPGWENYRGCVLEHNAAVSYGMLVFYASNEAPKARVVESLLEYLFDCELDTLQRLERVRYNLIDIAKSLQEMGAPVTCLTLMKEVFLHAQYDLYQKVKFIKKQDPEAAKELKEQDVFADFTCEWSDLLGKMTFYLRNKSIYQKWVAISAIEEKLGATIKEK